MKTNMIYITKTWNQARREPAYFYRQRKYFLYFEKVNERFLSRTIDTRGCVKSVRIRSYSGLHFPAFGLNTERYGISLRIQSECGKMRTRITPNMDTFHTVVHVHVFCWFMQILHKEHVCSYFAVSKNVYIYIYIYKYH